MLPFIAICLTLCLFEHIIFFPYSLRCCAKYCSALPALCLSIIDDLIPVDLLRPQTTGQPGRLCRAANEDDGKEDYALVVVERHFVCTRRVAALMGQTDK